MPVQLSFQNDVYYVFAVAEQEARIHLMSSAEVRNLTALVASAWSPSTSHQALFAATSRVFPFHDPAPTRRRWRNRAHVDVEMAIEVRLAFYLARCLTDFSRSSGTSEHLVTESSNSGLTKVRAVVTMITMMCKRVTASERLPDIQSVLLQIGPGCTAVRCTVRCLNSCTGV